MESIVNVNGKIFYNPSQLKKYVTKENKVGHYLKVSFNYYETQLALLIDEDKNLSVYVERFDKFI